MPGVVRGTPWTAQGQPTIHAGPGAPYTGTSGREKVDRLRGRDRLHVVASLELELQHALHEAALELRVVELRGDDLAERHAPVGGDRETQHDLALQGGVLAQRAIVEREDAALVGIEYAFDFLAAARCELALAAALRRPARFRETFDGTLDLRRLATTEAAAAGVAAQGRRIDAAARGADARCY